MRRPSPWLIAVVILLGALILREPRAQRLDDLFLSWFMEHTENVLPPAPITMVEITRDDFVRLTTAAEATPPNEAGTRHTLSPLGYALFLQAALEFQPTVIVLEPVLIWPDSDKPQRQVFLDQAMRVPKLLVGVELGEKGPHDFSSDDIPTFSKVTGSRGDLAEFSGVGHQPNEDIRLVSTPGFINLPNEHSDRVRVPMLFEYRGEVVPSLSLQAIMLWLRISPGEVKVELGTRIILPNGWQIPIHRDGTLTINPRAKQSMRRLTFNELLLAAQEHGAHRPPTLNVNNLKEQIVFLRRTDDPLQPPDVFATAIATIQQGAYVLPASKLAGWIIILVAALVSCFLWMISRLGFVLWAIIFSAGYAMISLSLLSRERIWLPMLLPLTLVAFLLLVRLFGRASEEKSLQAADGS